jgi:hypothetical protein
LAHFDVIADPSPSTPMLIFKPGGAGSAHHIFAPEVADSYGQAIKLSHPDKAVRILLTGNRNLIFFYGME